VVGEGELGQDLPFVAENPDDGLDEDRMAIIEQAVDRRPAPGKLQRKARPERRTDHPKRAQRHVLDPAPFRERDHRLRGMRNHRNIDLAPASPTSDCADREAKPPVVHGGEHGDGRSSATYLARSCAWTTVARGLHEGDHRVVRSLLGVVLMTVIVAACAGSGASAETVASFGATAPSVSASPATASLAPATATPAATASAAPTEAAATEAAASTAPTTQPNTITKPSPTEVAVQKSQPFRLTSNAFKEGAAIPRKYTCDGENVSPDLMWAGGPDRTVSLVLILTDPDAREFVHWLVYNMTGTATGGLPEGVSATPDAPMQGTNSFRKIGYGGPCPPSGTHHYVFTLSALDELLPLTGAPTADQVTAAMKGHVLETTKLTATYRRG
jgi:Raf kinase inhibitor-like YbhB/YbcL family protein